MIPKTIEYFLLFRTIVGTLTASLLVVNKFYCGGSQANFTPLFLPVCVYSFMNPAFRAFWNAWHIAVVVQANLETRTLLWRST
jgi:hypothetical protein